MEDYYYFPDSWEMTAGYVEAGFPRHHTVPRNHPSSTSPRTTRRASRGNADAGELHHHHHHHYLDACFRCGRHLGGNKDIFMYSGVIPFCSDECRQQQIEADKARERRSRQQPAAATKREREPERQSSSSQRIPLSAR